MNNEFIDNIRQEIDAFYLTQTSEEEIEQGVEDAYGVVYSPDYTRLLTVRNKDIRRYEIRDEVTVICDYAFSSPDGYNACRDLKIVHLDKNVKAIGHHAFFNNVSLSNVNLSKTLAKIGAYAFSCCYSLEKITLPYSLSVLDQGAFSNCISLRKVRIEANEQFLYQAPDTFEKCDSLKKLHHAGKDVLLFSKPVDKILKQKYGIESVDELINNVVSAYQYGLHGERSYDKFAFFTSLKSIRKGKRFGKVYRKIMNEERNAARENNVPLETTVPKRYNLINRKYLDLEIATKWATQNIGALDEHSVGHVFRWGQRDSMASLEEHILMTFDSNLPDIAGNRRYDAAADKWGGCWQMPLKQHFEALIEECDWFWVENGRKSGYYVMGGNGKNIFLPSTTIGSTGTIRHDYKGMYWTATQADDDKTKAIALVFDRREVKLCPLSKKTPMAIRPILNL